MTDLWSPQNYKDVDIKIGGYVKTMNVNTNPPMMMRDGGYPIVFMIVPEH